MRVARLALVLCSFALLGAGADHGASGPRPRPVAANSCVNWPNLAQRRWSGSWHDASGWSFSFDLALRRQANSLSGEFVWRLAATRDASMAHRVGSSAIERIRGSIDCATGTLTLGGYAVTDATLIAQDVYQLALGSSGALSGRTRGNEGRWYGVLTATPR